MTKAQTKQPNARMIIELNADLISLSINKISDSDIGKNPKRIQELRV